MEFEPQVGEQASEQASEQGEDSTRKILELCKIARWQVTSFFNTKSVKKLKGKKTKTITGDDN